MSVSAPAQSPDLTARRARFRRRKPVHGVTLGILMLDTGFERLPGDVGHAGTWPFPVQFAVVRGATPAKVLGPEAPALLDLFVDAAQGLVDLGVDGITTSCGFLSVLQRQLAAHCPVPVATSALLQVQMAQALLPPGQVVGVLTADEKTLTPLHLSEVGAPVDVPMVGLPPTGRIKTHSRTNSTTADYTSFEEEVLEMAERLFDKAPNVGAIVSECTNLAPYSRALSDRFGVPVYDIVTLVEWFHAGLRPRSHRID